MSNLKFATAPDHVSHEHKIVIYRGGTSPSIYKTHFYWYLPVAMFPLPLNQSLQRYVDRRAQCCR